MLDSRSGFGVLFHTRKCMGRFTFMSSQLDITFSPSPSLGVPHPPEGLSDSEEPYVEKHVSLTNNSCRASEQNGKVWKRLPSLCAYWAHCRERYPRTHSALVKEAR